MKTSGHEWTLSGGEKCSLCGDKDWMADKYCAGNPSVSEERDKWLEEVREENKNQSASAEAQELRK